MIARLSAVVRRTFTPIQIAAAMVLVIAIAAIPLLLRDSGPSEAPAATPSATTAATVDAPESVVTEATAPRRRGPVVGRTKNPFKPERGAGKAAKPPSTRRGADAGSSTGTVTTGKSGASAGSTGGAPSTPSSSSGGGGGTPSTQAPAPTPTSTPSPTPTPAATAPGAVAATERTWTPVVRSGSTSGTLTTRRLRRLGGVTTPAAPVAVLAGLRRDHETAVFVLAPGTAATGSGICKPTLADCKQLEVRPGGVTFLRQAGAEYRLELLRIRSERVSVAAGRSARHAVAPRGRANLRSLLPQLGSLRYDVASGAVVGSYG